MALVGMVLTVLTLILCPLGLIFSIWDIREQEKGKRKENEEKRKRRYIRENRGIFGVEEKGTAEMGSEQKIFVVSPKKMGIDNESGRRWG